MLGGVSLSVTKTGQVGLKSGRVHGPAGSSISNGVAGYVTGTSNCRSNSYRSAGPRRTPLPYTLTHAHTHSDMPHHTTSKVATQRDSPELTGWRGVPACH